LFWINGFTEEEIKKILYKNFESKILDRLWKISKS
jgi:hypothetical protein